MAIAIGLSFLLGLVSTVLALLIGPALKILMDTKAVSFPIHSLLGNVYGDIVQRYAGIDLVYRQDLRTWLPALMVILAAFRALSWFVQTYIWEFISEKVTFQLRQNVFKDFLGIYPQNQAKFDSNSMSTMINNDIKILKFYITRFFGGIGRESVILCFLMASLFLISWQVTLGIVGVIVPLVLFIRKIGKKLQRRSSRALNLFDETGNWLEERLLGMKTIKQFGTEQVEIDKFKTFMDRLYEMYIRAAKTRALMVPITETFFILLVAVLIYASYDAIQSGLITAHAFLSYMATLTMASQSASKVSKFYQSKKDGDAAIGRLKEYQKKAMNDHENLAHDLNASDTTALKLESLSVQIDDRILLNPTSLELKTGSVYLLKGPSGYGKSTLLKTIAGIQKPSSGRCVAETSQGMLAPLDLIYISQFSPLLTQDPLRFVSWPLEPDLEKVKGCMKLASLEESALKHDNRSDHAETFSGGQLQRLHIARAFYHQPVFAMFDEITSALDEANEFKVLENIQKHLKPHACVVIVSHRKSAETFADQILTLTDHQTINLTNGGPHV